MRIEVSAMTEVRVEDEKEGEELAACKGGGGDGGVDGGGDGGGGGERVVMRVLVVDDSPLELRVAEMILKRSGYEFEVIAVESGKKAMEVLGFNEGDTEVGIINDQNIDIILTDYCMPEMTGYDLLKVVKENSYSRSIPVVIMSSENDPRRISRCVATGARDFILKPLKNQHAQMLKTYSTPMGPTTETGTKRTSPSDLTRKEKKGKES